MANALIQEDDDEVITCNFYAREIKRYFLAIGSLCIILSILLFVLFEIGIYKQIVTDFDEPQKIRVKNSVNLINENLGTAPVSSHGFTLKRRRRETQLNAVDNEEVKAAIIRTKRLIEDSKYYESQFQQCNKFDQSDEKCRHFYEEILAINKLLKDHEGFISDIYKKYDHSETLNGDGEVKLVGNHQHVPKVGEAFENDRSGNNDDEITNGNNELSPELQSEWNPTQLREKTDTDKIISPLKNQNFDANGQFLSLCDQISRQSSGHQEIIAPPAGVNSLPGPTSSGFVTNNVQPHAFAPTINNDPIQQQVFNPSPIAYRSNPVCFYPPAVQQQQLQPMQPMQSVVMPQQFINPVQSNMQQPGRIVVMTGSGSQFGAISPSGQGFIQLANRPQVGLQSRTPSDDSRHTLQSRLLLDDHQNELGNFVSMPKPQTEDFVQGSKQNELNPFDNIINCFKMESAESAESDSCAAVIKSCKSKIGSSKICDGYVDCPLGADEIGCFGCGEHQYSCHNSRKEYEHSETASCFKVLEKCDGFTDCANGKDEEDCSMLVGSGTLQTDKSYMVPHTEGILYRNFRGRWYPVCKHPYDWAKEACEAELGPLDKNPTIDMPVSVLPGPFISKKSKHANDFTELSEQIVFQNACRHGSSEKKLMTRVKCPEMKCGIITKKHHYEMPSLRIRDDLSSYFRNKRDDFLGIVGGQLSNPQSWPFVVVIYINIEEMCGGTIHTPNWIISAAHCVNDASNQYVEVRAGLLRRRSHSPEVQIAVVSHVIIHPNYDKEFSLNDLALLRLRTPLHFNRWVRPICLPSAERVSSDDSSNWIIGPKAGTVCTAVGWGTESEYGDPSNNLHQVDVPITKCTYKPDEEGKELCAGEEMGGRDACQGDSGGPLFCQSKSNPDEHYLAGIVSHGKGCARRDEPGAYTRVALYVDWIIESESESTYRNKASIATKRICPGYTCMWSRECIAKQQKCDFIIDCLGGDDEQDCSPFESDTYLGSTKDNSRKGRQDTKPEVLEDASKTDVSKNHSIPVKPKPTTPMKPIHLVTTPKKEKDPVTQPPAFSTTIIPVTVPPPVTAPPKIIHTTTLQTTTHPIPEIMTTTTFELFESTTDQISEVTTEFNLSPIDDEDDAGPIKDHTNRNTTSFEPLHEVIEKVETFQCTKINQTLDIDLRCDGKTDCEDGTDELNCTCRETLRAKLSHLICNGMIDCIDLSDEKDCLICSAEEYGCRFSKKCIPKTSRCDQTPDCHRKEDEIDCVALTDGQNVLLDADMRPELNHKGIVCQNVNGFWAVNCVQRDKHRNAELAAQTCTQLGFSGLNFYNVSRITEDGKISHRHQEAKGRNSVRFDKQLFNELNPAHNRFKRHASHLDLSEVVGSAKQCLALYVECIPHSILPVINPQPDPPEETQDIPTNNDNKPVTEPDEIPIIIDPSEQPNNGNHTEPQSLDNKFYAPWSASVFFNGDLKCIGVLVDRVWVLVESSCVDVIDWDRDVIFVLFGRSKISANVKGKDEQIIRVDCTRKLGSGNAALLHLANGVEFKRHTLPTFVPDSANAMDDDCVAVSYGLSDDIISIPIVRGNDDDCKNCFEASEISEELNCESSEPTKVSAASKSGVIVCRSEEASYYPVSMFTRENGLCSFENATSFEMLDETYSKIAKLLNWPFCSFTAPEPPCPGYRCSLGKCIAPGLICDGKINCHDGNDEEPDNCKNKCTPSQAKCKNGNCFEKKNYCDGAIDCADGTDEPKRCSCLHYLELTDRSKICDGIAHCEDKSDEKKCPCRPDSYKCNSTATESEICIPKTFVCDSQPDCPNGEDEQSCYEAEPPVDPDSNEYYRVHQRSRGDESETKCVNKNQTAEEIKSELMKICHQLGFTNATNISHRLLDPVSNRTHIEQNYQRQAFKLFPDDPFSFIQLNDNFNMSFAQPTRGTKLVAWNTIDEQKCYQLELNCQN